MNSTVTAVELFRFLGTTMSHDLKCDNHIDSIVKRLSRACTSFASWGSSTCHRSCWKVLLCHHWIRPLHINNCLVQLSYQIWTTEGSPDCWANHWYNPHHSPRTELIQSEQKGWKNYSGTSHIQHTPSLTCYHLVDTTELWAPERPDTETVSSLKQSISWTLDNNYGTHTIYTLIYLTHILSLHFKLHIYTCTYKTVHCYIPVHTIANLYIIIHYLLILFKFLVIFCVLLSLSFCCTAVASVTKTNSSYVWTYLAIKLLLILILIVLLLFTWFDWQDTEKVHFSLNFYSAKKKHELRYWTLAH